MVKAHVAKTRTSLLVVPLAYSIILFHTSEMDCIALHRAGYLSVDLDLRTGQHQAAQSVQLALVLLGLGLGLGAAPFHGHVVARPQRPVHFIGADVGWHRRPRCLLGRSRDEQLVDQSDQIRQLPLNIR